MLNSKNIFIVVIKPNRKFFSFCKFNVKYTINIVQLEIYEILSCPNSNIHLPGEKSSMVKKQEKNNRNKNNKTKLYEAKSRKYFIYGDVLNIFYKKKE